MKTHTDKNIDQEEPNQACPSCGSTHCYTLSDERKMCRDCRKKYTPKPKSFRLPESQKEQIADYFWQMIPAEEGAKHLELNRKTLQRYYRHLRREIARASDNEICNLLKLEPSTQNGNNSEPVFRPCYIALLEDKPKVLAPEVFSSIPEDAVSVQVRYKNGTSDNRFKIDNLHIRKSNSGDVVESYDQEYLPLRKFWFFAIPQLSQYKVITTNNFYYFLKEMEFRFNATNEEDAINFLTTLLSSLPENS